MKTKGLRWWVVGLVALAAVVNYIDRQAFGACRRSNYIW
jgi:ACS family hexuronate transporter-like MFS transporter